MSVYQKPGSRLVPTIFIADPQCVIVSKHQSLGVQRNACTACAIVAKAITGIYASQYHPSVVAEDIHLANGSFGNPLYSTVVVGSNPVNGVPSGPVNNNVSE